MTNLDSILKSRDIALPTKVHLLKAMVFPVVIYGCESWTIKKAEHRRVDAFGVVLEKTLESPLDCKEIKLIFNSAQVLLKIKNLRYNNKNRKFLKVIKKKKGCLETLKLEELT